MESNKKWYTIDEAAERLNLSPAYVRTLIHKAKLPSTMVPVSEGSLVERHVVSETDIVEYLKTAPRRNRRSDGRNKFILYATPTEYKETIRVLKAAGRTTHKVATLIEPANIRKPDV